MDGIGLQVLVQPTHLQLPDSYPLPSSLSLGRVLIATQEARGPHQPTMDPKPSDLSMVWGVLGPNSPAPGAFDWAPRPPPTAHSHNPSTPLHCAPLPFAVAHP